MHDLRYTLVADGSSDVALLPILTWLLRQNGVDLAIQATWADLRRLPTPPRALRDRIALALELYPCDLLFVHRDAEGQSLSVRQDEIEQAIRAIGVQISVPHVCVIPVRMTEAWLLFDEAAIRQAAGNRLGRAPLALPPLDQVEQEPDPKSLLYEALRTASGLQGRRLRQFNVAQAALRVADLIADFAPLRRLSAFQALENDLCEVLRRTGWTPSPP